MKAENFYKSENDLKYNYWSFESVKNIYDIFEDKINGEITYMQNSKEVTRNKYHNAIIKHFDLTF